MSIRPPDSGDGQAGSVSSHGRSDMVLLHEDQVFVLEFKVVEDGTEVGQTLDSAIRQIRERRYAGKYRNHEEPGPPDPASNTGNGSRGNRTTLGCQRYCQDG